MKILKNCIEKIFPYTLQKKFFFLWYLLFIFLALLLITSFVKEYNENKAFYDKHHNLFSKVKNVDPLNTRGFEERVTLLKKRLESSDKNNVPINISYEEFFSLPNDHSVDYFNKETLSLSEIVDFDIENKSLTVSGATQIASINQFLKEYGLVLPLAVPSKYSTVSDIVNFNLPSDSLDDSLAIETIRSFRLLTPSGEVVNVNRAENPELFSLVIGGYGLFGIIIDAEFELASDGTFEKRTYISKRDDFLNLFFSKIFLKNDTVSMVATLYLHHPRISPDVISVTSWFEQSKEALQKRNDNEFSLLLKNLRNEISFFKTTVHFDEDIFKQLFSRNEVQSALKDILFEEKNMYKDRRTNTYTYYVPVRNLNPFLDFIIEKNNNGELYTPKITLYFIKSNREGYLSPSSKEDMFMVTYTDEYTHTDRRTKEDRQKVQLEVTKKVTAFTGRDALTNSYHGSREDMLKQYQNIPAFIKQKNARDSLSLFTTEWYTLFNQ
jgi:decaprenylphospho-beta-D-ribofuranose 2-oxidase